MEEMKMPWSSNTCPNCSFVDRETVPGEEWRGEVSTPGSYALFTSILEDGGKKYIGQVCFNCGEGERAEILGIGPVEKIKVQIVCDGCAEDSHEENLSD